MFSAYTTLFCEEMKGCDNPAMEGEKGAWRSAKWRQLGGVVHCIGPATTHHPSLRLPRLIKIATIKISQTRLETRRTMEDTHSDNIMHPEILLRHEEILYNILRYGVLFKHYNNYTEIFLQKTFFKEYNDRLKDC